MLAVDLINTFTDPGLPFGSDLDAVVEQARRVLDQGRSAGLPVLFTTVAYDGPDLEDAGVWAIKVPAYSLRSGRSPPAPVEHEASREKPDDRREQRPA